MSNQHTAPTPLALTAQALLAADAGRWAEVQTYYDQRATLLAGASVAQDVARELYELDQQLCERVRIARDAVAGSLHEFRTLRHALNRWTDSHAGVAESGQLLDGRI